MEWQPYLTNLSRHLLAKLDDDEREALQEYHNITDYLGCSPAKIEHIEQAQVRLGFELPNSLKSFYLTTDGWHSSAGFPIGIANVLSVGELFQLSNCRMREKDIYTRYVEQNFGNTSFTETQNLLKNCVVIIDFDGNELGFAVRTDSLDDWPVVTYNPDGGDFETYPGFIELMKDGMNC